MGVGLLWIVLGVKYAFSEPLKPTDIASAAVYLFFGISLALLGLRQQRQTPPGKAQLKGGGL